MAPEQLQGHPCSASDQYSLGVVIYEWLVGRKPFISDNELGIVIQHLSTKPVPLSERIASISPEVERVVMTTLAKDPKKRFESMQAFAIAFEDAVEASAKSFETIAISPIDPLQIADATVAASWSQFFPSLLIEKSFFVRFFWLMSLFHPL